MNEIDRLLISLIASVYATFWPRRTGEANAARYERRQAYHRTGIAWTGSSGGRDSRAWKKNERERQSLADANFAMIVRRNGQSFGLKPSNEGEARARSLLLMPPMAKTAAALKRLKSLADSPRGQSAYGKSWTREDELFRRKYRADGRESDWQFATETMMPLLTRDAATSNRAGPRVWYSFNHHVVLPTDEPSIEPSVEANDFYIQCFESSYVALAAATPHDASELGLLPLPCGLTRGGTRQ